MNPKIALLHATSVAIEPVLKSFTKHWSEASVFNFLDDSLTAMRSDEDEFSSELINRFVRFGTYASDIKADGILVTCSAFGPAVEELAKVLTIPVLKPNEAMFRAAAETGTRIGMLVTFAPALNPMTQEFNDFSKEYNKNLKLETHIVNGALEKLKKGDIEGHNFLVAKSAERLSHCDVIMLAQFSTSIALDMTQTVSSVPILSSPDSAVKLMKSLVKA